MTRPLPPAPRGAAGSRHPAAAPSRIGLALLAAAVLLAAPLACARKAGTPASPRSRAAQDYDSSFLLPRAQQVRWAYEGDTNPALAKKPSYLWKTIGFAAGSTTLDREAMSVEQDIAKVMQERPRIRVLFLGLTDQGTEKLNDMNLGLQRASAARDFVIKAGVARDRTEMATLGSRYAGGDPSDPVAQEKDRRVEIWLIEE